MTEIIIYIDIYLFVNLLINGSLMLILSVFTGKRLKFSGFFIADVFASLFGLMICLPKMNIYCILIIKFISALSVSACAFGYNKIIFILKNAFLYMSLSTVYAALTIWGNSVFDLKDIIYINNIEIYYNLPVSFLVSLMLFLMVFYTVLKRSLSCKHPEELFYDCFIELNGRNTIIKAFLDTGNSLKDVITGLPVIIIGKCVAESILYDTENFLNLSSTVEKIKLIPYRTVDGKSCILPAFKPDRVLLNGKEIDVIVAVSKDDFNKNSEFSCLLNRNCVL